MVKIPAGPFIMGSDSGASDERPAHSVHLNGFWIDRHEVTTAEWNAYAQAMNLPIRSAPDDYPIISWAGPMPWPIASGSAGACRPRQSGKKPPGGPMGAPTLGVKALIALGPTTERMSAVTSTPAMGTPLPRRWVITHKGNRPMRSVIWLAMSGVGGGLVSQRILYR